MEEVDEDMVVAEDVVVVVEVVMEVVVGEMTDTAAEMEDTTEIMEDIKCPSNPLSKKSDFAEPVVSVKYSTFIINFYSLSQIQWLYYFLFLLLL